MPGDIHVCWSFDGFEGSRARSQLTGRIYSNTDTNPALLPQLHPLLSANRLGSTEACGVTCEQTSKSSGTLRCQRKRERLRIK